MVKPPRRRLPPEARRLQILEAAERLLQADAGRVRVEDVVREAGVAKGTFFLYFPTWDELLDAVRRRMVAAFDTAHPMPSGSTAQIDWPALVDAQATAFVEFTLSRRGVGEAVFHSDFAARRPLADNGVTRIASVIRAGQEAGAFGSVDPEPTARLLFAAIHETADAVAGGADRAVVMPALRSLLRRALAP